MITVTLDSKKALAALQALQQAGAGMPDAMETVGATLQNLIRLNLGQGITPWGEPMEPLKYRKGVPLNNTRQHIYNRITHLASPFAAQVGLFDSESNKIGRVHQFGAIITRAAHSRELYFKVKLPSGRSRFANKGKANFAQTARFPEQTFKIPARPFLPIRPDGSAELPQYWLDEVLRILREHLEKAVGNG
jgi:phage gpG-like protein